MTEITATEVREDGALVNVLSGMGVPSRDKSIATTVGSVRLLSEAELETLYCSGIPRRYVDAIPDDMLRHRVTIKLGEGSPEGSENIIRDFESYLRDLNFHFALSEVIKLQRLYGGACLVMLIDDDQEPTEPVNWDNIRSVDGFVPLSRREIIPEDFTITDYSKPEKYRISTSQKLTPDQTSPTLNLEVHHTRVARFDGLYMPWRLRSQNLGWGMSCLQLLWNAFKRYETAMSGLEAMVSDADLFVHKIPGLFQRLAAGQQDDITKRLEANALSRSVYGGFVCDKEEEVTFLTRALANLAQATDPFARELQAATGWPASILMGDSPGGLGKEGRFEERVWASLVEQWQDVYCRQPITEIFTLLLAAQSGPTGGSVPPDWTVSFPSTFTETDTEKTALRLQQAQIDQIYASLQSLNPLEIRMARFGGTEFSLDTTLNEVVTERMAQLQDAQHETQLVSSAVEQQNQMSGAVAQEAQAAQAQQAAAAAASAEAPPEAGAPSGQGFAPSGASGNQAKGKARGSKSAKPAAKTDAAPPEPAEIAFGKATLQVERTVATFTYARPYPEGGRRDAAQAPGLILGPSALLSNPIYRTVFKIDSDYVEGPYVLGFVLADTAYNATKLLFPGREVDTLRALSQAETTEFVEAWDLV